MQTAELEARWAVRGQASREVWANPHALGLELSLSVVIYPFTCPLLLRDDTSQAQTGEPPSSCGPRSPQPQEDGAGNQCVRDDRGAGVGVGLERGLGLLPVGTVRAYRGGHPSTARGSRRGASRQGPGQRDSGRGSGPRGVHCRSQDLGWLEGHEQVGSMSS